MEERERQPAERAGQLPRLRQPNNTLYAATDLGVFFMQNDDPVWTKLGDNLPNTATEDVKIQSSNGSSTSAPSAAAPGGSRSSRVASCTVKVTNTGSIVTDLETRPSSTERRSSPVKKGTVTGNSRTRTSPRAASREGEVDRAPRDELHARLDAAEGDDLGKATIKDSVNVYFRIDVTDGGKHGKNDTYGITMSGGYSSGSSRSKQGTSGSTRSDRRATRRQKRKAPASGPFSCCRV